MSQLTKVGYIYGICVRDDVNVGVSVITLESKLRDKARATVLCCLQSPDVFLSRLRTEGPYELSIDINICQPPNKVSSSNSFAMSEKMLLQTLLQRFPLKNVNICTLLNLKSTC